MPFLAALFDLVRALFRTRRQLVLENVALRQQLLIPRPVLGGPASIFLTA